MASRYRISADVLRQHALVLQIGEGIAARLSSPEAVGFIERSEDSVDETLSESMGTPLKPTPALGQSADEFATALANNSLTYRNYPLLYIEAIVYHALHSMLASEFFATGPSANDQTAFSQAEYDRRIGDLLTNPAIRLGLGRRRNGNPFMPPSVAPRTRPQQNQSQ